MADELRRIPATWAHDHTKVIGHFIVSSDVTDEMLASSDVSWYVLVEDKRVVEMRLIPRPVMVKLPIKHEDGSTCLGEPND